MPTEDERLTQLEKSIEIIFERLEKLDAFGNRLERTDNNQDTIIKQIKDGLKSWKEKYDRSSEIVDSKLDSISDKLKLQEETDKAQNNQIGSIEDIISKLIRRIEGIEDRLEGGYEKAWPIEQLRSTVRNSAFTVRLIQGAVGVIGVTGVIVIVQAFFGWGSVDETEYTRLSTYHHLENRVDILEKEFVSNSSKWDVIYDNLNIEVGVQK